MTNRIRNSSQLVVMVLIIMISAFGCKSSKKAMEASKEKARIEQEATLRQQQEAEAKRKAAEEKENELKQREAEAKRKEAEAKASTPKARLGEYFKAISSSPNVTSANNSINEALTLFASPETPVLVVISETGGQKDYDRPTTIKDYLNYLKDQKKNMNIVSDLKFDNTGKITELELRKPQ